MSAGCQSCESRWRGEMGPRVKVMALVSWEGIAGLAPGLDVWMSRV